MIVGTLDWETSKAPYLLPWQKEAFPVACGLYLDDGRYYDWWFKHKDVKVKDDPKSISRALSNIDLMVGHNLKFDLNWLSFMGVDYRGKYWCTQTSEYLLGGQNMRDLKLKQVAERRGQPAKLDIVQDYWDRGINTNQIPKKILGEYLRQDCITTYHVYMDQLKELEIEKSHLKQVMMIHNNTTPILSDIEMNGMHIDVPVMTSMGDTFKAKLEEIDFNLRDMLGIPDLNLQSKDELSAALYGGIIKRKVQVPKEKERWAYRKKPYTFTYADGRTTTKYKKEKYREKYTVMVNGVEEKRVRGAGFQTDKSMKLKKDGYFKTGIEIIKNLKAGTAVRREIKIELIERSKIAKLVSTVLGSEPGKGFISKVQHDNRMHPQYNQSRTGTGRYSSKDPNGQNFPRSKEDQEGFLNPLKTIFIPSVPATAGGILVSADLGQLEWRVAAFLSQDPVAMQEIINGIDAHADNATRFFGDIKYRQDAKIMTFRLLYGGTAYSFFMDPLMPNFSLARWNKIVQDYYTKYCVLARWQAQNIQLVNSNGGWYISQFGRIYNFPLEKLKKTVGGQRIRYDGYKPTKVKNYEVQGTATGDIVPFAMYVIKQRMANDFPETKWIGQIHDAILFDTVTPVVERLADLLIQAFEDLPALIQKFWGFEFNVPLTGDVEWGPNYGTMIHKAERPAIGAPTEYHYAKAA